MNFIEKLQKLNNNQKKNITWVVIIILGLSFSVWRFSSFKTSMENLKSADFYEKTGIEKQEDTVSEIRKGLEIIKESTNAFKEGISLVKEIGEEVKYLEMSEEEESQIINNN